MITPLPLKKPISILYLKVMENAKIFGLLDANTAVIDAAAIDNMICAYPIMTSDIWVSPVSTGQKTIRLISPDPNTPSGLTPIRMS